MALDKAGKVSDSKTSGTDVIGAIYVAVPINRNLSEKLFGQLKVMMNKPGQDTESNGRLG
jgi:hypothetical protein